MHSPHPAPYPEVQEEVALALAEAQALAGAPLPRMLCHVFSQVLPHMQSATNYVPVSGVSGPLTSCSVDQLTSSC